MHNICIFHPHIITTEYDPEFKIANFLSFKDEVVFSFEATKDNSFEEYQVVEVAPGIRVLKIAIVYGEMLPVKVI